MNYSSEEILKKNAASSGGKELLKTLKRDVQWFSQNFHDDPEIQSGWGHVYFCWEDGSFLTYDRESPFSHKCAICGKNYTDVPYNAAWICFYRYDAIMSAWEAATLYRLEKEADYLEHFMRILNFYSEHYSEFEPHGRGPVTSGCGKITPQALNEAIFLVRAVNGLELLKDVLPSQFIENVSKKLLIPGAEFINAQKKIINNIPCWINSAVALVGFFTQNDALLNSAFEAPLGLYDQIRQGVTSSYFWFEGSIHYNCFTLEAFLNQLLFARIYHKTLPEDIENTLYQMVLAPCRMAFSNGVLPNPNDGWPNLSLKTYSYLYEMAARIFDSSEIRTILWHIYHSGLTRVSVPMSSPIYAGDYCLEYLLFSEEADMGEEAAFWDSSYNFEASNYALLRNKNCEVFLKYGHCTDSHAHPDKMNLEVSAFGKSVSRDLSNCGYAAKLCNEFYRTSVSHNTVVIDGISHTGTEKGSCLKYNDKQNYIQVSVPAYGDVTFLREIQMLDNGFLDHFRVSGQHEHTIDWIFHVEGSLRNVLHTIPAHLDYTDHGYQHLKKIKKVLPEDPILHLIWDFSDGVFGEQEIDLDNMELYLCESYDNPVNRMRNTLIIRKNAKCTTFKQKWNFKKF